MFELGNLEYLWNVILKDRRIGGELSYTVRVMC